MSILLSPKWHSFDDRKFQIAASALSSSLGLVRFLQFVFTSFIKTNSLENVKCLWNGELLQTVFANAQSIVIIHVLRLATLKPTMLP